MEISFHNLPSLLLDTLSAIWAKNVLFPEPGGPQTIDNVARGIKPIRPPSHVIRLACMAASFMNAYLEAKAPSCAGMKGMKPCDRWRWEIKKHSQFLTPYLPTHLVPFLNIPI